MVNVKRSTYRSNVRALGNDLDQKLERIVGRAARDGAAHTRGISRPPVSARAESAETSEGVISARVFVPRNEFWATMFDKGTLGKRRVPLKQPGRRERSWKVRRGRQTYTAHRSAAALRAGGIPAQFFFARGKRHAQKQLAGYLRRGL